MHAFWFFESLVSKVEHAHTYTTTPGQPVTSRSTRKPPSTPHSTKTKQGLSPEQPNVNPPLLHSPHCTVIQSEASASIALLRARVNTVLDCLWFYTSQHATALSEVYLAKAHSSKVLVEMWESEGEWGKRYTRSRIPSGETMWGKLCVKLESLVKWFKFKYMAKKKINGSGGRKEMVLKDVNCRWYSSCNMWQTWRKPGASGLQYS